MNRKLALAGKVGISLVLIYILLRKTPIADLVQAWGKFSLFTIASVIVLYFIALLINVFKWKIFLPGQPFARLFRFTFIDVFYNMVLPGQLSGEVAKAFRLGKRTGEMKNVISSVWLDKLTGIIGLLIVMLIGFSFSSRYFPWYLFVIMVLLIILGIGSIYALDLPFVSDWFLRILGSIKSKWSSKIADSVRSLLVHFKGVEKPPALIAVNIVLGACYQIAAILMIVVLAAQLSIHLSLLEWFWIFGVVSIIQFIPISVAGLGVREASFVGILAVFAVPASTALVLSLSIFGIQLFYAFIGAIVEADYNIRG